MAWRVARGPSSSAGHHCSADLQIKLHQRFPTRDPGGISPMDRDPSTKLSAGMLRTTLQNVIVARRRDQPVRQTYALKPPPDIIWRHLCDPQVAGLLNRGTAHRLRLKTVFGQGREAV